MAILAATLGGSAVCTNPAPGLVSWWRGEGNALDSSGTNHGSLLGGTAFAGGEVGQAFSFNSSGSAVRVPASTSLDVGQGGGFTIEAWINPADVLNGQPIFEWNSGSYGVCLWVANWGPTAVPASLYGDVKTSGLTDHAFESAAGLLQSNVFQHVAFTYDQALGNAALYINGLVVTQKNVGTLTPLTYSDVYIGYRPSDGGAGRTFRGQIDEVSLYNRALSQAEILAVVNAGTGGKCATPTAPFIITQPQSQTVGAGGGVTFTVTANGTPPLNYQWRFNGTNRAGATGSSLTITNLQVAQAGNYSVQVTNANGSVLSSNALLTVTTASNTCVTISNLVSWWRAENNAADSVDGNSGTLLNGASITNGFVGQAFNLNGSSAYIQVPDAPNLRFSNAMTFEAWIYPRAIGGQYREILSKWDGGVDQRSFVVDLGPDGKAEFAVNSDGGVNNIASAFSLSAVTPNHWIHIAGTYDGAAVKLYLNGVLQSSTPRTQGIFPGTAPLIIGSTLSSGSFFDGLIDEPGVYNRALSPSEVQAIYDAGTAGKCAGVPPTIVTQPQSQTVGAGGAVTFAVTASGTPPLSYQWRFNGTNRAGATGSSLTITNLQVAQAGNYSVQVTNANGSVLSSNALLTVTTASNTCVTISNLVSWWPAEGSAADVADGNSGTLLNGASITNGYVGQAFNLNGTSAYIQVSDAPNLRFTNAMTFEAWIYPRSIGGQYREIISKWEGGVDQRSFVVDLGPDGKAEFAINSDGGVNNIASAFSLSPVSPNHWLHIAGTYDGAAVKLYLNGVLQSSTPWTQGIFPGTAPLSIGSALVAGSFFDGQIDEPSVYNRALSQSEVQAIYNAGTTGKCPDRPPIARDVPAATIQNQAMSIPLDKFLALASDPDNDSLTVSSVTPASTNGGTVAISSGSLVYSPANNYAGADRFGYTISDGRGGTASAFVFVQVRSAALPSGNMLPPVTLSNGFQVNFLGIPGYNYTLQRATNVSGPWITIGTALANPSGLGTFADTNAPAASAFYRTVYP